MGLFSRRSEPEGFYTGDAPASMPGIDGASPSAYQSRPVASAPSPADPRYGSAAPIYPQPPPAGLEYQGPAPTSVGQRPPPVVLQRVVRTASPRASRAGIWIVLAIVLAVLIPVGFTVYAAFSDGSDAVGESEQPRTVAVGSLGAPITVPYRGAELQVTVKSAVAQPVDGWGGGSAVPDPKLVVDVMVTAREIGSGTVTVLAWDWSFQPSEGPTVDGDIITDYEPELEGSGMGIGETAKGLVTFDTGADTGMLLLNDPYYSAAPAAQWEIHAGTPKVVTGTVGKRATGQIAGPGFTATLAKPQWLKSGDMRLRDDPESGSLLRVELTLAGLRDEYAGQVEASDLWFTPRGGKPIQAAYPGHLKRSTVLVSISDTEPQQLIVGFDVKKSPGVLELREASGKTVIRWPIS